MVCNNTDMNVSGNDIIIVIPVRDRYTVGISPNGDCLWPGIIQIAIIVCAT
jgi:hypothetical protein